MVPIALCSLIVWVKTGQEKYRNGDTFSPHSPSFKLFNQLPSGSIHLPRNQDNLVSKLGMCLSGWKEVVLPHNPSEISKMLSVKRKCWPFRDDRKAVAKCVAFSSAVPPWWAKNRVGEETEKGCMCECTGVACLPPF